MCHPVLLCIIAEYKHYICLYALFTSNLGAKRTDKVTKTSLDLKVSHLQKVAPLILEIVLTYVKLPEKNDGALSFSLSVE